MTTHLIIGDAHAKPGVSNERFSWLGKFVVDIKPDVIIDLGDWEDMPSLSSYDMGKKSYEGRRYRKDLEAAWGARESFNSPIDAYNELKRRNGKRLYRPSKYSVGGNHFERRVKRVVEETPLLAGTLDVEKDGRYAEFGWDYIPFLEPLNVDGITYQHYFTSGVKGLPIGGESPGLSLIRKQFSSCVQGHSHVLDMAHRTRPDRQRVWGIHAGCFLAEDQWEDYAGPSNHMWMKGVLLLKGVNNGDFQDFEWISIKTLKERYGE